LIQENTGLSKLPRPTSDHLWRALSGR
jgi:hypothetical protein